MNCIIVDDEPLAREAMKLLIEESSNLQLIGSFNSASTASDFMEQHVTDLVFLDIQMPGITGIEFAPGLTRFHSLQSDTGSRQKRIWYGSSRPL